ncbi:DNA repair protein rad50 [Rhodosporidiobolus nylandii]
MRRHREREDYAREIAKLESELSTINSTATPEEIQAQLSDLSEQIRVIKAAMEKIRVEQQTATITLARKKQELKDKEALEQRQIEACEDVARLEKESKKENKLLTIRADFTHDKTSASRQLQADDKSAEQLHHNKREICGYETRGGDNKLSKCEPKLKQHDAVIANTEQRIAQLQGQISQIDQTLADSEAVLRNLQDNIRLRTEKRQLESVTQQIKDLDEDSACKACRKFENKYNKRRRKQTDLQLFTRLGGETNTMKNDELDKGEELETEYKDIEEKYRCELINVKTARMSNQDLEKLQKEGTRWMEEINDTTAELWTKTYQGTDIAEVMIKSDADGKTTGTAHSYNYR